MIRFTLLACCVAAVSCSKKSSPATAVQGSVTLTATPKVYAEIHTISLNAMHNREQSIEDVIRSADRKILIKNNSDSCLLEWRKLTSGPFWKGRMEAGGDMRIVLALDGDVFAFNEDGEDGYVNGRRVGYDPAIVAWFRKYLVPLADG